MDYLESNIENTLREVLIKNKNFFINLEKEVLEILQISLRQNNMKEPIF